MSLESIIFDLMKDIVIGVGISFVIMVSIVFLVEFLKDFSNKAHVEQQYKNKKINKILQLDYEVYKKWEEINRLLMNDEVSGFNANTFKTVNSCIMNDTINSVDFPIIFDIYEEFLKDIQLDEFKKEDIISIEKRGIMTHKINEMNEYLHMVIKKEVAILQDTYQKDEFEEIEELLAIYKDKYNEGKGA